MPKPCESGAEKKEPCEPWRSPRDRLRFIDLAPPDRFCDLILTGGVTSAVAYPGLVAVLASAYRFHAIGGSSSGAGIAAMAAAAEFRRRHGSAEGFRVMLDRVGRLAEEKRGRTGLRQLFQPERRHRLLFDLVVAAFAQTGGKRCAFVRGLLGRWALAWLLLPAAALLLPGWLAADGPASATCWGIAMTCAAVWAVVAWTLIAGLVVAVLRLALALRRVVKSDYGLCTGLAPDGRAKADEPPLTEWLHGVIQAVAGRREGDDPLTFDDLARAPGSPNATLGAGGVDAREGVALQIFSANVSHGRPYRFPLAKDERLYFRPDQLRRVVPREVVEFLLRTCKEEPGGRWPDDQGVDDQQARWRLPRGKLPIIVAARMSVSFPLLFTAVRLWAPHGPPGKEDLKPCIFMDGGLCSNFPIHLFDSAVPAWPTFGVSLRDRRSGDDRASDGRGECQFHERPRVFLPRLERDGRAESWFHFDAGSSPWGRLWGLVGAMLSTVKDWNDATSARLPGVWDRVVRVELEKGEGGLNIAMSKEVIERLAQYGTQAGRELIERYSSADAPNGLAIGWNEHRWVRLLRLRAALALYLDGVGWSFAPGRHAESMAAQVQRAVEAPPRAGDPTLSPGQAAALRQLLGALVQAEQALNAPGPPLPEPPDPRPELRQRAPL